MYDFNGRQEQMLFSWFVWCDEVIRRARGMMKKLCIGLTCLQNAHEYGVWVTSSCNLTYLHEANEMKAGWNENY